MPERRSPLRLKVPRWVVALVLTATFCGVWWSFEVAARQTALKDIIRVYRDPDHRLRPDDERAGTNGDGLRCALEAHEIPEDGVTILFLGDSFVFGVQVDRAQALPQRFETGLREVYPSSSIHVVNGAWESASPLLALRLLKDVGRKYKPDIVVYGLDMSDFRDDLMYGNLLDRRGIFRLSSHAPAMLWMMNQSIKAAGSETMYQRLFRMPSDRFFVVNQSLDASKRHMERSWEVLNALHEFCAEELGAAFYLVVLPRNFQYSTRESPMSWEKGQYTELGRYVHEPFRFFAEKAKSAPFPMSSLLPAFRETGVFPTCFVGDPHWTPAGTDVAARALVRIAVEQQWVDQLQ